MADTDNATMSRKAVFDALTTFSVKDLTALRDAAEAQRMAKLDEAKNAILERARADLADLGLSIESFMPGAGQAAAAKGKKATTKGGTSSVPVKYRGPGGEEWSGRGRSPKWVQVAEAEGKSREDFKV